jgi:hypothetical protein
MFVASYEGCQQDDKYAHTIIVKNTVKHGNFLSMFYRLNSVLSTTKKAVLFNRLTTA